MGVGAELVAKGPVACQHRDEGSNAKRIAFGETCTAICLPDQSGDFSIRVADENDRLSDRHGAVELAWHNQSLKLGLKRKPVQVGDVEAVRQLLARTITAALDHSREPRIGHYGCQMCVLRTAADEQEPDVRCTVPGEKCGCAEHGLGIMGASEIPGIADHQRGIGAQF